MSWPVVYCDFLFVTSAVMLGLAVAARRRSRAYGTKTFAATVLMIALWILMRALFVQSKTPTEAALWDRMTYLFEPLIPAMYVIYMLVHTGNGRWLTTRRLVAMFIIPGLTIIISQTTGLHGLFTTATRYALQGPLMAAVEWQAGPWFWVYLTYGYSLLFAGLAIAVNQVFNSTGIARRQTIILVTASVIIAAASISDLIWTADSWFEIMPIGYACFAVLSAYALFRYHFLDIMPVARDAVLANILDAIIVADERGRVVDLNPAATELFGPAAKTVIGEPVGAVLPLRTRSGQSLADVAVPPDGIELRSADGQRTYDLRISPLLAARDRRVGSLLVLRDSTARQQAEAEREQLIAELDAFAHSVAHDLKNPITLIMGYSDLLTQSLDGDAGHNGEDLAFAKTILTSSITMNHIIDSLLLLAQVSHSGEVPIQALEMTEVVAGARARLEALLQSTPVELTVADRWPEALGYAPWVEGVWANLISNAVKYGGQLPRIELGADRPTDGMVRFWVQDRGPGLSPEEQTQLFTPHTRLGSNQIEGYGLGLSIVRRIVERLGGSVGVEAKPGQGSRFWFTLPKRQ